MLHPYTRASNQYDPVVKIEEESYPVSNRRDRVARVLIVRRSHAGVSWSDPSTDQRIRFRSILIRR